MDEKTVTIFGTSKARSGDAVFEMAFELGSVLAEAGYTIVNGGYGGTMLASAKGAALAGGKTIGVTCSAFGQRSANEHISREILTATLDERLETLIQLGKGYVVLPGSTGTLLELAKVWELQNKGFLSPPKPIILLGEFWKPLVNLITSDEPDSSRCLIMADGPLQAKEILAEGV
jgi:uncharacterized protein (TIGR00730 family)